MRQLRGWKEIARYLGTSERTAQRWERELGLPVHRVRNAPGATVYTTVAELDAWRRSPYGESAGTSNDQDAEPDTAPVEAASSPDVDTETAAAPAEANPVSARVRSPFRPLPRIALAIGIVCLVAVAVEVWAVRGTRMGGWNTLAAGHRNASSSDILVIKISDSDGRAFLCHVPNGRMATYWARGRGKIGLAPSLRNGAITVTVADIRHLQLNGPETVKTVRTVALGRRQPAEIVQGNNKLKVEWVDVEPAGRSQSADGEDGQQCGISCRDAAVTALEVSSACGSCREPGQAAQQPGR